jgi:hypothetical protein
MHDSYDSYPSPDPSAEFIPPAPESKQRLLDLAGQEFERRVRDPFATGSNKDAPIFPSGSGYELDVFDRRSGEFRTLGRAIATVARSEIVETDSGSPRLSTTYFDISGSGDPNDELKIGSFTSETDPRQPTGPFSRDVTMGLMMHESMLKTIQTDWSNAGRRAPMSLDPVSEETVQSLIELLQGPREDTFAASAT